jgi:hypothetical protein
MRKRGLAANEEELGHILVGDVARNEDGSRPDTLGFGGWSCGGCVIHARKIAAPEWNAQPQGCMAMTTVDRDEPEWTVMWAELEKRSGDTKAECPDTHETWQYMGTWPCEAGSDVLVHEFRHRHHPQTKQRELVHITASLDFSLRR